MLQERIGRLMSWLVWLSILAQDPSMLVAVHGFGSETWRRPTRSWQRTTVAYRRSAMEDTASIATDTTVSSTSLGTRTAAAPNGAAWSARRRRSSSQREYLDPSSIEFASFREIRSAIDDAFDEETTASAKSSSSCPYPFAAMLQLSARYIADHAEAAAVIHLPGELFQDKAAFRNLMSDMALAWLLGMKLVVIADCRLSVDGSCDALACDSVHECHNSIRITDSSTLRQLEEESGYLRFEIERLLNKSLRRHISTVMDGNVVGGNFYTATALGQVRGVDYQHTGYPTDVHVEKILQVLDNHDIVLLTTIGTSEEGDLVNVNGEHLAAVVAAQMGAQKLIYMASQGAVLRQKGQPGTLQDVPLSWVQAILDYYQVRVYKVGVAAFEKAKQMLPPSAVELLLHMGWSAWAMEQGVHRAHIVNPSDGALLEELYTTEHGTNTCLYHDDEGKDAEKDDIAQELDMFLQAVGASTSATL